MLPKLLVIHSIKIYFYIENQKDFFHIIDCKLIHVKILRL